MANTIMEASESSSSESSSATSTESSRKFWNKPSKRSVITEAESSGEDLKVDKVYALPAASSSTTTSRDTGKKHGNKIASKNTAETPSQRRQTKVLLVSLIESLCKTYGGTPETTRKMFFNICQTLRTLGFIDSEFQDDVASMRFTYHRAFEHIFYAAAQNVREQELRLGNQPKLLTSAEQQEFIKEHIESLSSDSSSFLDTYADNELLNPLKYSLNHIQNSRYENDFVEVGMLGRGGFASAYKVRNKLDDVEYAIKKIRLSNVDYDEDEDDDTGHAKILREIKNLARLEHHNVVRYYSSWLEYANDIEHRTEDEEGEDEDDDDEFSESQDDRFSVFNGNDPTFDDSLSSHISNKSQEMSYINFGHNDNSSNSSSSGGSTTGDLYLQPSSSNSTIRKHTKRNNNNNNGGFILYIQMQLCPSTLHEYLKYRNQNRDAYFDEQQNIELFVQILEGAAYIHQEGLIHRDLKPSNIFLSRPANNLLDYRSRHSRHHCDCKNNNSTACGNNNSSAEIMVPKIGDFGLAASVLPNGEDDLYSTERLSSTLDSEHSSHDSVIELFTTAAASFSSSSSLANKDSLESDIQFLTTRRKSDHSSRQRTRKNITSGVGTRTYAAPEQLAIPCLPYDEKADIYSLGIILFELYYPFSTAMERADSIENLKKGIFPKNFIKTYPTQANIILSMMNPDPCLRPTALQLLDHELFQPYYNVVPEPEPMKSLTFVHDQEMAEMKYQFDQMKHENEDLHRRLEELQSRLDNCQVNNNSSYNNSSSSGSGGGGRSEVVKKRHHTAEEDQECSAHHESKKKELGPFLRDS